MHVGLTELVTLSMLRSCGLVEDLGVCLVEIVDVVADLLDTFQTRGLQPFALGELGLGELDLCLQLFDSLLFHF